MESINQLVGYRNDHLSHHEYVEVVFIIPTADEQNLIQSRRKQNHIEEIYFSSNSWPRIKGLYWEL